MQTLSKRFRFLNMLKNLSRKSRALLYTEADLKPAKNNPRLKSVQPKHNTIRNHTGLFFSALKTQHNIV